MLSRQGSGGHVTSARAAGLPGAPPAFAGRGVLNMGRWGRRRGGGKRQAASRGTKAAEPSPQAGWRGGEEDLHTGRKGERPCLRAAGETRQGN